MEHHAMHKVETKHRSPEMAPVVDLWKEIRAIQGKVPCAPLTAIHREAVQERLAAGTPVLSWEDLAWDREALEGALEDVLTVVERHLPGWSGKVKAAFAGLPADGWKEMIRRWWRGEEAGDREVTFLLTVVLAPSLRRAAEAIQPWLQEISWQRGICPVCGGTPDFAVLERENGVRRLFCSRCDTGWRFPRIQCPFCGTTDPAYLAYFTADDPQYRLYVCEACHRYLKAVDRRLAVRSFDLDAERIGTLWLDVLAQQKGYEPG